MEYRSQGAGNRSHSNVRSSLGNYNSNNKRQIESKVVKINTIEDYGKNKAHLSEPLPKKASNWSSNVNNFYSKVNSEIK